MSARPSRRLAAVFCADVVPGGRTPPGARPDETPSLAALAAPLLEERGPQVLVRDERELELIFDTAEEGVEAGVVLRRESRQVLEAAGLRLRVAIHAGEVVEDEGGFRGAALDFARGLRGRAEPGQVVLSELTFRLLGTRETLDFTDLGEHECEGSEEPVRLYAARELVSEERASLRELLQDAVFPLQLLDQEDEGGMGEIHLARDPSLRRTVAVKVLRSELAADAGQRARFFREARVIAALSHPNVVTVYAVGELADGTPYFVMDYVEGGSYADRVEAEGPLSVPEARRVLGEVAAALEAAHQRGVVHRDIKASNVLFDPVAGRALVTDWGIAALDPGAAAMDPEARLTRVGSFIGSPMYMSPEQLAGDRVGPETDVYSLGLLAFELLTGEGPFRASTPHALMAAHLREEPPKLSSVRHDVDPELDELVTRCLSKSAWERPTAADVRRRLAPGADAVLEWPPPGLEDLRGRALRVAGYLTLGLALWLATFWAGVATSHRMLAGEVTAGASPWSLVLTVAGTVAFVWGLVRLAGAAQLWFAGLGLGYGWSTLMEVAADRRGDTGMLIVGGREYLSLSREERTRLRRGRVSVAGLVLGVPLMGVLLSLVVVVGSARGVLSAREAGFLTLGVPGALALAALAVAAREWTKTARFRRAFRRHKTPRAALRRLVEPWYQAFEENRRGALPGRGATGRRWGAVALTAGGGAVVVLGAWVALSLLMLMLAAAHGSPYPYNPSRIRDGVAQLRPGGGARFPVDSTLTMEDGTGLLLRILEHRIPAEEDRAVELAARLPSSAPLWYGPYGPLRGIPLALAPDSVVRVALRGLSADEQEYLRYITEGAIPAEWYTLGRAGSYDEVAVAVRLHGLEEAADLFELGPPRYSGMRTISYLAEARAALLISEGRTAEAEELLRATLSVGFVLVDHSIIDFVGVLIGSVIGNRALESLRLLYAAQGRGEDAARIAPTAAAGDAAEEERGREEVRRHTWAVVTDTSDLPQIRWRGALNWLPGQLTCETARGLLFGVPPEVEAYLRGPLREQLVRTELQGRLYDSAWGWEEREVRHSAGAAPRGRLRWAYWTGRALGSPRISACAYALSPRTRR